MKAAVLIAVMLVASGCRTMQANEYADWVSGWIGYDINNAISEMGIPSATMELSNGVTMYEWTTTGATRAHAGVVFGNVVASSHTEWCKTTLTANTRGRIISWSVKGNGCG